MVKNIAKFICCLVFFSSSMCIYAQNDSCCSYIALEIDRVAILNGDGFSYVDEWDSYEANKWGLVERHRKMPYELFGEIHYMDYTWWSWKNEAIKNETLLDGSHKTTSNNPYITVSFNLHPQWLYLGMRNNTTYYLAIDLGSLCASVSPPEPNLKNENYDSSGTYVPCRNNLGRSYCTILLPPFTEATIPFYSCLWWRYKQKQENYFFDDNFKNKSRVDFTIEMGIFRSDPLLRNKHVMQEKYPHKFSEETPHEVWHEYRGPYFKEGDAFYIHQDYETLFDNADLRIEERITCKLHKSSHKLKVKENEYGFLCYADVATTSSEFKSVPVHDNSQIRKEDEPTNSLGMSISEMKATMPGMFYVKSDNGMVEYECDGINYIFKDQILVCEGTIIEGGGGFGKDAFNTFVTRFKKTNYSRLSEDENSATFYYSDFSVSFVYFPFNDSLGITYQSYSYWK